MAYSYVSIYNDGKKVAGWDQGKFQQKIDWNSAEVKFNNYYETYTYIRKDIPGKTLINATLQEQS